MTNKKTTSLLFSVLFTLTFAIFVPLHAEETVLPAKQKALPEEKQAQEETGEMPQVEMQKMVVTGSREAVDSPDKLPVPVQIITSEDIENIGAVHFDEVVDLLQGVELVTSPDLNISPGFKTLRMRGMDLEHVVILVDGRRLPGAVPTTAGYSYTDISTINVDMIERIEVLRDGASAQYGSDAVAGVINIITKKYVQGFSGNTQYGQSKEGDGIDRHFDASAGFPLGRFHLSVGGFYNHVDHYDRLVSTENPYRWDSPDYEQKGGTGKVVFDISDQQFLALDLRYVEGDSELRKSEVAYRLNDKKELDAGLAWEGEFGPWKFYAGSFYATQDINRRQSENPDYKSDMDWDIWQHDANAFWDVLPWLSLFTGASWREENIDSGQRDFNETRGLGAVFAEAILRPFDGLKVQVSGRYEDYSDFGSNFAPKLATRYEIVPSLAVRASISKSYQVPTMFQMHDEYLGAMGWADIYGNPDLDPANGMNITGGVVWDISKKHQTTLTLDLYHNQIEDRIDTYYTGDFAIRDGETYTEVTYENYEGTTTFKGAEVNFSTDLAYGFGIDIMGNYLVAEGPLEPDGPEDEDLRNRPRSYLHVNLRYGYGDRFWGNVRYKYRGKYVTTFEKIPGFDTVDAQLNYAITDHVIIYAGGRNLFDEDPPADPERYETGHMQGMIDSTIGAFYYGGLRLKF